MRVLGVLLDHHVEVFNRMLVHLNHLVGLCALVNEANVRRHVLNAFAKGKDALLEFFNSTVAQPNMIVNVWLVRKVPRCASRQTDAAQGLFERLDAFFELFMRKVGQSLPIKYLWIVFILIQRMLQIASSILVLAHVVVALRAMQQKLHIIWLLFEG